MRMPFGSNLKKLRQEYKLTLREVAATIDIDQSSLSKIEKGKMIAPQYIIKPAAALFQVDFRDLQIHYLRDKLIQMYERVPYILDGLEEALTALQNRLGRVESTPDQQMTQLIQSYFSDKPIERVWLFGSAVRDKLTEDSDIDILVELSDEHQLDLFDYMMMSDELQDLVNRPIDLVVDGQLDEGIADRVEQEKVLIYEQR